jgi:uroporphyrinogen III methyltransferase / synthase
MIPVDDEGDHEGDSESARLRGIRVLVTRPATSADVWRVALERAGATVIVHPTIEVAPPPSWAPLDEALARLSHYHWLVFTSAHAVRFACTRLPPSVNPAALGRPMIAAVGAETARALAEASFRVAFVPADQRQEGLVAGLLAAGLGAGDKVLFPRAVGGRDHFVEALTARGVVVDLVPASQTIARPDLAAPPRFDVATFASPSALSAYVTRLGTGTLTAAPCVVIGATTAEAARAVGLAPVVARGPNIDAVIDAIAGCTQPHS